MAEKDLALKIRESNNLLKRWCRSTKHARYIRKDDIYTTRYATVELYVCGATECKRFLEKKGFGSLVKCSPEENPINTRVGQMPSVEELIDDYEFHESARRFHESAMRLLNREHSDKYLQVYLGNPNKIPKVCMALCTLLDNQYGILMRSGYLHEGNGNFDVH